MLNQYKSEMLRLMKGKMFYILIFVMAVMPLFVYGTNVMVQNLDIPAEEITMFAQMDTFKFINMGVKTLFTGGASFIMAIVLAVHLVCEEYHGGMLKMRVMASDRIKVSISKILLMISQVLLLSVVNIIMYFIVGLAIYGGITFDEIATIGMTYFFGSLSMMVFGIWMMSFGFLFNKPSSAITVSICVYLAISLMVQLMPEKWIGFVPMGHMLACISGLTAKYGIHGMITGGVLLILGSGVFVQMLKRKELTV